MAKTVTINQDKLLMLKERVVDKENLVNQNGHAHIVREASPEVDEYEIGGEEKNGENVMGGNYFHANELNENKISYVDLSEVGEVVIEDWTYDEEEYQEWLVDNELQDTPENKMNYIEDFNVEFDVDLLDNQTYHTMCGDWVYYDDLVEKFGDNMAKKIESGMIENGSFKFDTSDIYADENYDINNPRELDDIAMKLLPHGEYFKGCRGFILSNGVVVYTEGEHNDVLRIPGINSKWQFIELGNIRLLPNSIDIGSEPTYEQEEVLEYMLRLYDGEEIYLDIFSENGEIGAHYPSADCNYIMGEINRYYSEGIRPQGGGFYESKESGKKILVSEKQLLTLKENTFENWFGNSILKDENGEPIKMYHGTDAEFDSFSKEFIGKTGAHEGYGFNFTPYESRARSYNSKNVIEAYLKVENPMITGSYKITPSKLAKIISEIDKGVPYTDTIVAAYEPTRYNENWDERYYRRALPVVVRQLIQYNRENEYGDAGIYADICLCGNGDKVKVIHTFEKLGYDSVIFYDNYGKLNTVVVFEPNQIKRTNNKTFSIDSDLMGENNKSKHIIKESQESKSIAAAKKLVMQKLGYNEQEADEFIRIKLRNDIPSLRTPQGGKFILGVARMFCDGELRSANDIGNLNSTLKLVASDVHINEYDRNLNGMSCQELIQKFAKAMSDNLDAEKDEVNQMVFDSPSDYEIVRIDSFEQAEEYGDYVTWCVTHDSHMFDSYTSNGINQFYFCLKSGFENVEKVKSEGCPLDEYGLSMIAVSVNENGMLNTCTCRWNHDNGGDDSIMNTKEISQVIGVNFFEKFKPNNRWKELITNVMQRLANGEDPRNVFDYVGNFNDGFAWVELNGKWNFINQEGSFLSDQWFDYVDYFNDGLATVGLNGKWNFINQEGILLSDQWFDKAYDFNEGFVRVKLNGKWNFINQEGRLLSDQWFDVVDKFNNGFAWVELNGKRYIIDTNGDLRLQESKSALDKFTDMITESKNSSRAHRQTREIIAKRFGSDINDPSVIKTEQEFEAKMFGEGKRTDWFIVLEPIAYNWYIQTNDIDTIQEYLNYIFLKGTESTPPSAYIANIRKYNDFNELKQFIDQQRKADDEASMEAQIDMEVNLNQNYEVQGPLSFEEANKIGEYSCPDGKICYTQDEYTWDDSSYGNYDNNKCYVLLRNDWKDVQPKHDGSEANNGLPSPLSQYNGYDSYGLSMIFVWIGKYGQLSVSNTRWNHNAQYAPGHSVDRALSELDIARLMGAPFEQVFGVKKLDVLTDIKEKLNNSSINVNDIFDDIFDIVDNVQGVKLGNKYNYVVYETRSLYGFDYQYRYLLWDKPYEEWFDCVYDFDSKTSLGVVVFGDKSKFIDKNGKFYDIAETTKKLLADGKNDMFNIIDGNGPIYRVSYTYSNFNYIDTNTNKLLWDKPYEEWFDWGQSPRTFMKYILVEIDRKCYYFNVDGNIYDFLETVKKRLKNENPQYVFDWVETTTFSDIYKVQINSRYNFVNKKTNEVIWDKPYEEWFISACSFYGDADTTKVTIHGDAWYTLDRSGKLYDSNGNLVEESKMSSKDTLIENYELEVDSSEIDLSSFKKRHELAPNIWKPSGKLDSRVRLKLLDIADDFWEFVNITWVKPSGIILTGSICNFNWSKYSDIDLHLIADFKEIDEKTVFVKEYLDAKKNEWNNEHSGLQIMGYKVELYVQDLEDEVESNGVYDLEENDWIKEPDMDEIKSIGLNKFSIKERAAKIMTIIDDMYDALASTDDSHKIEQMGDDAKYLWDKVKKMRQNSLEKDGESGNGNIVYKILRRTGYLDRLFKLSNVVYDKSNSITESVKKVYVNEDKLPLLTESQESENVSKKVYINEDKLSLLKESQALKSVLTESVKRYLKTLNEEVVADGNSEHNPYKERWKAERKALKDFICNYGTLMQSKEDDKAGRLYKCFWDKTLSNLIGYNYCLAVQYDEINNKPKSTIYVRACDKFTPNIRRNIQYDTRGYDNVRGTYDDLSNRNY